MKEAPLIKNRREQIEAVRPAIRKDTEVLAGAKIEYRKVEDTAIELTKEKAYWFLELETFAGERPVSERHVQHLYDEMRKGRFIADYVILASVVLDGREYRINGQHTCWSRLEMPSNWQCPVRWIQYSVNDPEDLAGLYGLFDVHKSRTASHCTYADLVGGGSEFEEHSATITRVLPAFRLWLWPNLEERVRKSPHDVATLARDTHTRLFLTVCENAAKYRRIAKHTWRASVHAAMFATYDKVPTKADEFWEGVATGLGLAEKTDPRYVLRETLINTSMKAISSNRHARIMDAESLYRICILAWNKWRKGEKMAAGLRVTNERVNPA